MKIKNIVIAGLVAVGFSSCNDYLEVDAPSKYDNEYVFSEKSEMSRVLNGVYAQLLTRSEERRVGKECVSTCESRGGAAH